MSTILHEAVLLSLKEAHTAFFSGNWEEYGHQMKTALAAIEAVKSLGLPMDGSTGRPVEVLLLQGEYQLVSSLNLLASPAALIPQYEMALMLFVVGRSKVITPQEPWLPSPENLLDYYGVTGVRGYELARDLERAQILYGRLTGGGGGVAALYRAQLAFKQGEREEAAFYARKALAEVKGDNWIRPQAESLLI